MHARWRLTWLMGTACLFLSLDCSWGEEQRLPVVVTASSNAERLLNNILQDIDQEQFEAALLGMQKLHQDTELVRVSPVHYLRTDLLLASLARQLIDLGRSDLMPLMPEPHVKMSPLSEVDFSMSMEGWRGFLKQTDKLWRKGKLNLAYRRWQLMLDPDSPPSTPHTDRVWRLNSERTALQGEVLKRLFLSHLICGEFRSADRILERMQKHWVSSGNEPSEIKAMYEQYQSQREFYRRQPELLHESNAATQPAAVSARIDLTHLAWNVPLHESTTLAKAQVLNNLVILQDQQGIRLLDAESGQAKWSVDEADEGYLIPPTDLQHESSALLPEGMAYKGLWIASHVDYTLHAYDLEAEGLLAWAYPDKSRDTKSKWQNSGQGILVSDTVVIPQRSQTPDQQLQLICLNATTGQRLWSQEIGVALIAQPATYFGDRLVAGIEEIFWNINGATVACVEAETGERRWLRGLNTRKEKTTSGDQQRIDSNICYHQNHVFALSHGYLTALDPNTGSVLWESNLPPNVHQLIGISDLMIILSGDQLWGLDRETGLLKWRTGKESQTCFRKGILRGKAIFWSTDRELWTVDAQSGKILQKDDLQSLTGDEFRILSMSDSVLLMATTKSMTALGIRVSR